ncbi:cation:proton antiporter [Yinghuangia soli]|uniref:Cation:proton antiporter n=1 Tax=Yinghuangia soli TaxID=2908204 RepID=A0AA41Q2X7_9ACTN|nr:cation:proton antiporter [Yinghuangia soli]MCF2530568.1 cation:proton antiporter [Yinghuangia soli]
MSDTADLVVVVVLVALAPMATAACARWIPVPTVVVEILLGVLAGPALLGWIGRNGDIVNDLSEFGLVMLMFLAGYEIDVPRIKGRPLTSAAVGWGASLVLGLGAGLLMTVAVGGETMAGVAIGLALTTTALGTILPIVRDAGLLPTPLGANIMAIGTVGEFAPIVAIALLLSGRHPGATVAALAVFAILAAVALLLAVRPNPRWLDRLVVKTLHSSGQLAVRLAMVIMVLLVWFADELELDNLMGAFTAGLVLRLSLWHAPGDLVETISAKLDGIGFGFFIPIFFVMSGVKFDLDALLDKPGLLALIPLFLVLFLLVRGLPTFVLAGRGEVAGRRRELALFASTALPLVVVITNIAVENGYLSSGKAAALVGAGMISVMAFPQLALRTAGDATGTRAEEFDGEPPGENEDEVLKDR